MDLREAFSRRVSEKSVAEILNLIAAPPNLREKPNPGDIEGDFDFWFDGGAAMVETGCVHYRFENGARADVAAPIPALSVTIVFPDGSRVRLKQESLGAEAG